MEFDLTISGAIPLQDGLLEALRHADDDETTGGLTLGGLVALRPDHDPYIAAVQNALAVGRIVVVVHAYSAQQRAQAETILKARGGETTATL